ncbi:hypothetical protein [Thermaerobacillus caldiproteolyticus]|uniref:hypothetical protein n=1 Tax=Thermaerobacillus caldiproteolyticus TaxID=247480 RepID=UPI00358DAB6B
MLLPGVQANSIAAGIKNAFGINPTIIGIGLVIIAVAIIFWLRQANRSLGFIPFRLSFNM